jgi:hypothetical protein
MLISKQLLIGRRFQEKEPDWTKFSAEFGSSGAVLGLEKSEQKINLKGGVGQECTLLLSVTNLDLLAYKLIRIFMFYSWREN